MSKYNLNDEAGLDYFDFEMDGHVYKMNFPSSRDVLKIQDEAEKAIEFNKQIEKLTLQTSLEEDTTKKTELQTKLDKLTKDSKQSQETYFEWCAKYVEHEKEAPEFKKTILEKPLKYMLAFIKIVEKEFEDGVQ